MMRQCCAAVLAIALTVPASGQSIPNQKFPIFTGVVCDTDTFAEHYINLVNSAISYDEVWHQTNAGQKEPVCGILKVAYYPVVEMPVLKLLRGEAVDIVPVMVVGEQVTKHTVRWMLPGVKRYLIMTRKTRGS